jgi:hypothetical protein
MSSNRLVDFQRGVGFSNWRAGPSGVRQLTFSHAEADPRIAFVATTDGRLRRYNTATSTWADQSPFPVPFSTGGPSHWLQNDRNDDWFIALSATAGQVIGFQRSTGTQRARSFSGLDEMYLDTDGRYALIYARIGSIPNAQAPVWDLQADAVQNITIPGGFVFHVPALRGFWMHHDSYSGNGLRLYRLTAGGAGTQVSNFGGGYTGDQHSSGGWLQEPGTGQYYVMSSWDSRWDSYNFPLKQAIGYIRADAGDIRLVAHHYSAITNQAAAGGADSYWSQPHAHVSPDGTLIMFTSNMNGTSRVDTFLAEVPVQ